MRPGSFRLFFLVLYVRSLQTVHASAMTGRFSALATGVMFLVVGPRITVAATLKQGLETGGTPRFYFTGPPIVNASGVLMAGTRRKPPPRR